MILRDIAGLAEAVWCVRSLACTLFVLLTMQQPAEAQRSHAMSSDGKLAAYEREDTLWLVPIAEQGKGTPRKLATVPPMLSVPRWAPTGDSLAYYDNKSGTLQLWVYEVQTKSSRQISFVEGGIDPDSLARFGGWNSDPLRYSWSPDGSTIAFATQVPVDAAVGSADELKVYKFPSAERLAAGEPIVLTTDTPPDWTLHGVVSYGHASNRTFNDGSPNGREPPRILPRRSTQLFLLDVQSGKTTQLTNGSAGYFSPEWSPDGKRLAFMSTGGQSLLGWGPAESHIYTLDLATRQQTRVTRGSTQKAIPRWSPDGQWIAYFGRDITGTFSRKEEGVYIVAGDGRTAPVNAAKNVDRHITDYEWGPDGSSILMSYWDGLFRPLIRANVKTGAVSPISPSTAFVDGFAVSSAGFVWSQLTDPNAARMLWFANRTGHSRSMVEIEPARDLRRERRYEPVQWTNSLGDRIEGILIYPLNYVGGKSYPLVVDAYGAGTIDPWPDRVNYVKASPNYLVFRPNHRAPHMWMNPLKSAAYTAAAVGPTGVAIMVDDMLSGVDMLIKRGIADADRMCLFGFSNGGLEGEQVLTRTNRFKCAVFQSPSTSDWLASFFLSTDDREAIRYMYGIAPWEDPSLYTALVPLYHADKITTPILLAVGDQEAAVIPTIEMYNVLRFLKKEVTLLRYTDQSHGFTGAAEQDFQRRIAAFFSSHLDEQHQLTNGASSTSSAPTCMTLLETPEVRVSPQPECTFDGRH